MQYPSFKRLICSFMPAGSQVVRGARGIQGAGSLCRPANCRRPCGHPRLGRRPRRRLCRPSRRCHGLLAAARWRSFGRRPRGRRRPRSHLCDGGRSTEPATVHGAPHRSGKPGSHTRVRSLRRRGGSPSADEEKLSPCARRGHEPRHPCVSPIACCTHAHTSRCVRPGMRALPSCTCHPRSSSERGHGRAPRKGSGTCSHAHALRARSPACGAQAGPGHPVSFLVSRSSVSTSWTSPRPTCSAPPATQSSPAVVL